MTSTSAKNIVLLIAVAGLLTASTASGAELVLRERATMSGPMIRLGDVADISAGTASMLKGLVTTPLLPTPAPGTQQFVSRSQIRDLLVSRGIDVGNLRVRGAMVVEIGHRRPAGSLDVDSIGTTEAETMTFTETDTAVEDAIERYLIDHTSHDQWQVEVELRDKQSLQVAGWAGEFTVEGPHYPRPGRKNFVIRSRNGKESFRVQASIVQVHSLLFARRGISRGDLVRAADVEVRQHEGSAPNLAIRDLAQVVGMEAKRTITEDSILTEGQVSAPLMVKRGETVTVSARTGGVTVRTMVVAQQDGAMGELVQVESVKDKKRFAASVSGNRQLEVFPTGARVEDFATLGKRNTQRR